MADSGDGTYTLSFTPSEAGPIELLVALEQQGSPAQGNRALLRRSFAGVCSAGKADAQCCVAVAPDCAIVAGQSGTLQLRRADRCNLYALSACSQLQMPDNIQSAKLGVSFGIRILWPWHAHLKSFTRLLLVTCRWLYQETSPGPSLMKNIHESLVLLVAGLATKCSGAQARCPLCWQLLVQAT